MFSNCSMKDKCENKSTIACNSCTRNTLHIVIRDRFKPIELKITDILKGSKPMEDK